MRTRDVALDLLQAVLRQKRPLDAAMTDDPALAALEGRDRAYVRLVVSTVLRRLGQLDAVLSIFMERPLPPAAAVALDILRIGAAQLLFLGTPAHASVDTAVRLVAARGHPRLKGLVNALLRRVSREGPALVAAQDEVRLNTPTWLYESWTAAYGAEAAAAISGAHLREAPLDISVKLPQERAHWAEALGGELLPTGTVRVTQAGLVPELPGYQEGAWWVQDAAAALPVLLMGNCNGQRVIDLAAAPGGKSAQLAAAGAHVTAVDRSGPRLRRLSENFERLGLSAEIVVGDAANWRPYALADAVLLDAPCSATGTIRRHPDVVHLKEAGDVRRLSLVQDRLLRAAVEMVKPGGMLVYACCSLQPEEGPDRIKALIASGAPVARDPVRPEEVGGLTELVTADGDLRTLPSHLAQQGGLDGFYVARLRRTA